MSVLNKFPREKVQTKHTDAEDILKGVMHEELPAPKKKKG